MNLRRIIIQTAAEIAAAYVLVGIVLCYLDPEYRMRALDTAARLCRNVAYHVGRWGILAELEYRRVAESERMI